MNLVASIMLAIYKPHSINSLKLSATRAIIMFIDPVKNVFWRSVICYQLTFPMIIYCVCKHETCGFWFLIASHYFILFYSFLRPCMRLWYCCFFVKLDCKLLNHNILVSWLKFLLLLSYCCFRLKKTPWKAKLFVVPQWRFEPLPIARSVLRYFQSFIRHFKELVKRCLQFFCKNFKHICKSFKNKSVSTVGLGLY